MDGISRRVHLPHNKIEKNDQCLLFYLFWVEKIPTEPQVVKMVESKMIDSKCDIEHLVNTDPGPASFTNEH